MRRVNLIAFILIGLIALVAIGGFWYFQYGMQNPVSATPYGESNTPSSVLTRENQYFADANAASKAGNYEQAKQLYTQALATAKDSVQASQIQFTSALLEDRYGSAVRAVDLYKQIVANPANASYPRMKANAIANMVELYYRNGNPAVTTQIFKDAPYSNLFVPGDVDLTYRHLAEYAVSFYPLALPELRIAGWYAYRLTDEGKVSSDEATSTYPAIIQSAVSSANQEIDRMKTNDTDVRLIPNILARKSALYLNMYSAGLATAQETEAINKAGVDIFASIGEPVASDGFARYYYAVFLSEQGPSRLDDLKTIVGPFYNDAAYKGTFSLSFFASEKTNTLGQKARLAKIAKADPKFKALLISLGWNEKDF
ncbi:MAG: tetratricopeptide repeat protein [Minisyncoccota bacterium]